MFESNYNLRLGWIGFHMEGIPAIVALLKNKYPIKAVITLEIKSLRQKSGSVDYEDICKKYDIPLYRVTNINSKKSISLLKKLQLDVIFVIGWSQIINSEILQLGKIGVVGAHASLLPKNRGSAPINWALINDEKMTGNSLMWLKEGVDTGDIIDQVKIPIDIYDTCKTLYEKVAQSNKDMILKFIPRLLSKEIPRFPQKIGNEHVLKRRKPEDGLIDWSLDSKNIYNFIRALTRPYPGAFSWLDDYQWIIWECAWIQMEVEHKKPGEFICSVFSPQESACGQLVACGKGQILLLEIEGQDGKILKGKKLSNQKWRGKNWKNE